MGMFGRMFESFGYYKKEDIFKGVPRSDNNADYIDSLSDQNIWSMIDAVRDLSATTRAMYNEYDVMSDDVIIGSALDMYADDTTQVRADSGSIVTVTPKTASDKTTSEDLSTFLSSLDVEDLLWETSYNTAKYGDYYWRVHKTEKNGKSQVASVEVVSDPAAVVDLFQRGKRVNFGYDNSMVDEDTIGSSYVPRANKEQYSLYSPQSFIHFSVRSANSKEYLQLYDPKILDDEGKPRLIKYSVERGESMIEDVRSIYRILRALEDSLLASRIAKSEYLRVYNVEVGTNSTPKDTRMVINRVKNLFDSKASLDVNEGYYESHKQPRPYMDPIFNPTADGKGSIDMDVIGGDFDVKSIVDIDYFKNKLFAGIKIPASFLGYEENLQGDDQGEMLAQLDIRYARSLKKLISSLEDGLTDLCNIWLQTNGREHEIGKFEVNIESSSINEEKLRISELEERVQIITNLTNSISSEVEGVNTAKILSILMEQYIPNEDVSEKLIQVIQETKDISDLERKVAYQEKLRELAQLDDSFVELLHDYINKGKEEVDITDADDEVADEDNVYDSYEDLDYEEE